MSYSLKIISQKNMVKDTLVSEEKHDLCGNYVFGKHHLQRLKIEHQLSTYLVHSDVCGLMRTSSYPKEVHCSL